MRNATLTPGGKRDPTQGNIVGHNAGGPPRVPQECFSKQHPWATADSGSDRAIIMFVASRTLSKCRPCCCHSEDLNGCVGLKHSRGFPEFSYSFQFFPTTDTNGFPTDTAFLELNPAWASYRVFLGRDVANTIMSVTHNHSCNVYNTSLVGSLLSFLLHKGET